MKYERARLCSRMALAIPAWFVAAAMAGCSLSAAPTERSTPSADAPDRVVAAPAPLTSPRPNGASHSETASGFSPAKPRPGRTIVVMTESGCSLHGIDGPIPARHLIVARNTTDDAVAFDIGMLARGHTFEELAADIAVARDLEHRGGPFSQRPRYFHGSITGDTTFGHGGAPGPSLLLLSGGGSIFSWMTWAYHPGAFRYHGRPLDPRGTWAVICYRSFESTGLEPIDVLGPVEVGKR